MRRFHRFFVFAGLAVLIAITPPLLSAQTRNPKDRPPPIITVTKVDGSTVRGTIVEVDPDNLTLSPPVKAGETAEPVAVAWSEIRKVSNGLTREKAWAQWKDAHRANLCDDCHGDRTVRCPTCHGVGHDPAASANCAMCKGEMLVDCKTPKCADGKIPCPAPCVKLTEGRWFERDGKKWRKFPMRGGSFEVSEGHAGEVWRVVNDAPVNEGKCTRCGGVTIIEDPACEGTARTICKLCVANKAAADCTNADCDKGRVACQTCKQTGLKPA